MTRIHRALLGALILMLSITAPSFAGARLVDKIVHFRHYTTPAIARANGGTVGYTTAPPTSSSSGTEVGWLDSLSTFYNSSAGQAAAVVDTTEWFTINDRAFVPYVLGADSLSLLNVHVEPTYFRGNGVAADSFTFTLQGSFNGIDPAAGVAIDVVELGSSNQFWRPFDWTRGSTAATLTNVNMGMFPYYRVLLKDFTGTTGDFELGVSYWKDIVSPSTAP